VDIFTSLIIIKIPTVISQLDSRKYIYVSSVVTVDKDKLIVQICWRIMHADTLSSMNFTFLSLTPYADLLTTKEPTGT